jgi:hypothetical protein
MWQPINYKSVVSLTWKKKITLKNLIAFTIPLVYQKVQDKKRQWKKQLDDVLGKKKAEASSFPS